MLQLQSAFGVFALLALAWVFGENRSAVSFRQACVGLVVTLLTAVILLKLPFVARAFGAINDAVGAISSASRAGTSFVFGYLGGGALPFDLKAPGADFILAFQALPIVLVMSVLTTLLSTGAFCRRSYAAWPGSWSVRSGSAARSVFRPRPTYSSAWWRRRSSSGPIWQNSRAANCSWS